MKVYNTLSGQKEEFLPQGNEVKMYVCGINPYADCHIGHAMSYIVFDVVRRYLEFQGYKVRHVQNITDIEDNIIERANRLGIPVGELTEKYTIRYFEDMEALNVTRADVYPKATEEIPKIIEIVQGLVDKGYAYECEGNVYFRVRNVADYGKLSNRSLESMMAGARIEAGEEKEYPMDFVLWKAAKPDEPSWESPWGQGRPGWHIECSAMSLKYLGDTLDIHGGGQDLVFPHHENEITQSESFTGKKPFARYWLHNGLVQLGEDKMSKSLGNLITIREALERYSADAIRIFSLSSHYRSPLTYSEEALEAAERGADRLRQAIQSEASGEKSNGQVDIEAYRQRFIEAMDDDFNTAQAMAILFDVARDINRLGDEGYSVIAAQQLLSELAGVLGLTLEAPEGLPFEARLYNEFLELYMQKDFRSLLERFKANLPQLDRNEAIYVALLTDLRNRLVHDAYPSLEILKRNTDLYSKSLDWLRSQLAHDAGPQDLEEVKANFTTLYNSATTNTSGYISLRDQLRGAKQFHLSDEIRAKMAELGIALEDTPQGTVWRVKR